MSVEGLPPSLCSCHAALRRLRLGRGLCAFDRRRSAGLKQQDDFYLDAVHSDHDGERHRLGLGVIGHDRR